MEITPTVIPRNSKDHEAALASMYAALNGLTGRLALPEAERFGPTEISGPQAGIRIDSVPVIGTVATNGSRSAQ